jgi:hypothetical protein
MFRIPWLPVLGSDLTRHANPTTAIAGAVYIGLGDRFDDDRRLVRETASKLRPARVPAAGPSGSAQQVA